MLLGNLSEITEEAFGNGFIKKVGNIVSISNMILGENLPYKIPDKYKPSKSFCFSSSCPEHTGRFELSKEGYINPPYNVVKKSVYGVYIIYLI